MSVDPFDTITVLLAKHAQHVVLDHFPIALLAAAAAFDHLAQWRKSPALAVAAYLDVLLSALSTLPAVGTGLAAWQWALGAHRLRGILLAHLVLGCVSSVLILHVFWIHRRARLHPEVFLPRYRLWIEAVALVLLTGYLGGFLSGVNGPG